MQKMCWNIVSKLVHLLEREWERNTESKKILWVCYSRHDSSLAKSRCSKTRRQFPKTQNWIKHHKINIYLFFFWFTLWLLRLKFFKWKLRFLPNHRILEAVSLRKKLYRKLHLPLLLPTLCCSTSTAEVQGRDYLSNFTGASPPGFSNTLWTTGLLVNGALSLLSVEEGTRSRMSPSEFGPALESSSSITSTSQLH